MGVLFSLSSIDVCIHRPDSPARIGVRVVVIDRRTGREVCSFVKKHDMGARRSHIVLPSPRLFGL